MEFSFTLLFQCQWSYWYMQGEITIVASLWWTPFKTVQMQVTHWLHTFSGGCVVMRTQVAHLCTASLVVSATEQDLNHANTYCVISCCWDVKLLVCCTQKFIHYLAAWVGHFVNFNSVGVLKNYFAHLDTLGNEPTLIRRPDVTFLTHLEVAHSDGRSMPLLHVGVAWVREVA